MPADEVAAGEVSAVEFYHAGFDRFFFTASSEEVASLDAGVIRGWQRAWTEFKVDDVPSPGMVPVCRFFSAAFASRSSHFYTAFPEECEAVKADPAWTYEGIAFYVRLPDASGRCAAGTMPIYRGYNSGRGGAPAHRFTPYFGDRCASFRGDCVAEGVGGDGIAFCAPASFDLAQSRTQALSGGEWEFILFSTPMFTQSVQVRFGEAQYNYAPSPPTYMPHLPYTAVAAPMAPLAGVAGWDPVAGKITFLISGFQLFQFEFDGSSPGPGCRFEVEDLFDAVRGPCIPVTVVRR